MTKTKKKIMTTEFVKRKSRAFFNGKKAILLEECSNGHQEIIPKNTEVTILCKNQRNPEWLNIKCEKSGIEMDGILPFYLELLKTTT